MGKFIGVATILSWLIQSNCIAGWTSSGGEIYSDQMNPWFLKNTKSVRYCIEVDEKNFGVNRNLVEMKLKKALQYWRRVFNKNLYNSEYYPVPDMQLATQDFVNVSCADGQFDIAFLMGAFLNDEQKEYVARYHRVVGLTVRTEYDPVNLKARGFVYIAPPKGPLAMAHPRLIESPWLVENSRLLELMLIHELGHVFGIRHDVIPRQTIMNEELPNNLVDKKHYRRFALEKFVPDWLQENFTGRTQSRCHKNINQAIFYDYFRLPKGWLCYRFKVGAASFKFYGKPNDQTEEYTFIGEFKGLMFQDAGFTSTSLFLTKQQQVFPDFKNGRYQGGHFRSFQAKYRGDYKSNGKTRPLMMIKKLSSVVLYSQELIELGAVPFPIFQPW